MVNEVVARANQLAAEEGQPVLLLGVSLGTLISLNILRRSELFETAVMITGGDIAKIAQKMYPKAWPQSYTELAETWKGVNMYTEPRLLQGNRLLFVLHVSTKLIDVQDVRNEITHQQAAGNHLQYVERGRHDYVGTIIEETVLFPKRTLGYIEQLEKGL